jgi:RHH-type transcriptional regulator, proline utilization regulon repressor / proline dehydrogenase / delta 1-pyrroline-5-carboxylate dehydrogenase
LTREVFGPVLHVVRWHRDELPALIDAINATGYGLTHGIHTRIDETVEAILGRIRAGNVYVNRNIIGAVVGVQPFGGHGLSGTGPKAGGPLYLYRLLRIESAAKENADSAMSGERGSDLEAAGSEDRAGYPDDAPPSHRRIELPGPTGESNVLEFHPRGMAACVADRENALVAQAQAALSVGNTVVMLHSPSAMNARQRLRPFDVTLTEAFDYTQVDVVLLDADLAQSRRVREELAATPGKIVPVVLPDANGRYDWRRLVAERTVTINTAAAGGNTALLSLAEAGSGI